MVVRGCWAPHGAPGSCGPGWGFSSSSRVNRAQRHRRRVEARALFDPPPFRAEKLTVTYQDVSCELGAAGDNRCQAPGRSTAPLRLADLCQRRYTLTHNDLTGDLQLTVGREYNLAQISGLYTRLVRDEVVAEWRFGPTSPSLHVFCHVSGEERWLAPPSLRNYIFRRELPLVLDTFLYADRGLLARHPELGDAKVYVHFQSTRQDLDRVEVWGVLGQRSTWQPVPASVLKRVVMTLTGQAHPKEQAPPASAAAAASAGGQLIDGTAGGNVRPGTASERGGAASPAATTSAPAAPVVLLPPSDLTLLQPSPLLLGSGLEAGQPAQGEVPGTLAQPVLVNRAANEAGGRGCEDAGASPLAAPAVLQGGGGEGLVASTGLGGVHSRDLQPAAPRGLGLALQPVAVAAQDAGPGGPLRKRVPQGAASRVRRR